MNLTDNVLGEAWYWAAWFVWVPLFARVVWWAPWKRLQDPQRLNLFLGLVVVLALIWSLKAGVKPGLALHLLGANVFTLVLGPHLAFIGLSLVALCITLNGEVGWFAYAMNSLLLAGVGVVLSHALHQLVIRVLPQHFFIYVFVNAFFCAALVVLGVGLASSLLYVLADAYAWDYLSSEYLPYFLLLGFSEAWLSGMFMTVCIVYRPHWVVSFDDSRYLGDQ